jgi:integrase
MFPGQRDNDTISNNTILKGLEVLGYKYEMTGHGFRGVASTILHGMKIYPHEEIELQLSHVPEDEVAAAYNHEKYIESRTKMMQDWSDYLEKITEQ